MQPNAQTYVYRMLYGKMKERNSVVTPSLLNPFWNLCDKAICIHILFLSGALWIVETLL